MRRTHPRYPRPQEVLLAQMALNRNVPMDAPMRTGWRESQKLVPNFRFQATSHGIEWVMDVYCGGYCFVQVGESSETVKTIQAAVRFILTHLAARS